MGNGDGQGFLKGVDRICLDIQGLIWVLGIGPGGKWVKEIGLLGLGLLKGFRFLGFNQFGFKGLWVNWVNDLVGLKDRVWW